MSFHPAPVLVLLGFAAATAAEKLDKESKKWIEEVASIILPEEERTFRGLKDKADREEFQKIFWARRDPNPETPENEYQAEFRKARVEAERRYSVPGRSGAATDCGRVFILLGEPNEVKKQPPQEGAVALRDPETWVFRDRPGMTFVGGEARIAFDVECQIPQGARSGEQMHRLAETKIAQPNLGYRFGKDGRLVTLEDLKPKPTPAQALLKTPRQDFPASTQAGFLRTQDGGTVLVGLARGDASTLAVQEAGGKKTLPVVVVAQATGEDGRVAAFAEQATTAEVVSDGSFVASYRMALKPGKYTLQAGALEPKTQKGSLASMPVEVPDLNKGELSMATLFLVERVEPADTPDPQHPFAAFALGNNRIVPYFGTVLAASDAPSFFYQFYDARTDEASGKRSAVAKLTLLKDGKPVASAADDPFEGPVGANLIGPVPLSKYGPGKYVAQLKVRDNVAQKDYVQEVSFEVK